MKRSEALTLICHELELLTINNQSLDHHGFLYIAENVLGMLPPEIPDDSLYPESNFVSEWEKE